MGKHVDDDRGQQPSPRGAQAPMTMLMPALPSKARASEPHAPDDASGSGPGGGSPEPGQRLRRVRESMGLTRAEVSARARMDEGYLTYLEETSAQPSAGAVLKLARALGTTVEHLLGVQVHDQPGSFAASGGHRSGAPDPRRCWEMVGDRGVARVVLQARTSAGEPSLRVVDYMVSGAALVFSVRAGSGVVVAARDGEQALVEVDHRDGWTVLLGGPARLLPPDDAAVSSYPWERVPDSMLVSVEPTWLTARRLSAS
ncbi:Helix-turn-helix domain-containing protein [Quadrisphaera granulorum]|uniref:Helix-turn-helix protein n=1 Tax=Quadrisphaera granulorum TaxID=317664 RepID=A0A315ZTD8_9ACTN|nr:helix-turn-helix transcriptional regulator [Quadrisphaera granulorum]PWJ48831.1 helix-turn-helix protein [Quadrisphaera granulorum]SZE98313.1 Helix-turn-helix domain-containing protein [Quadrisphaera granulorum]